MRGILSGLLIARFRGLQQLVLSIAIGELVAALANKLTPWTGGSDGLSGITPAPVFGVFGFDLYGHTAYWLSVGTLAVVMAALTAFARSPFRLTCKAIRDDDLRARMIGLAVYPRLVVMYGVSGAVAGIGGALSAITTGVIGLDSVSFERSAEALVMLVLGGAGHLWGALFGAILFQLFEHYVTTSNPYSWLALVGLMLIAIVVFVPGGLMRGVDLSGAVDEEARLTAALRIEGLARHFGGVMVDERRLVRAFRRGQRRADRPQRRGKDDARQSHLRQSDAEQRLDRVRRPRHHAYERGAPRAPRARAHVSDHAPLPFADRRREHRPAGPSAAEPERPALFAARRRARRSAGLRGAARGASSRAFLDTPVRELAYGQQRLVDIAIGLALEPRVLLLDEPAAGVPHDEAPLILGAIARLRPDIAVMMIEHDMDLVFRFAKRVLVLAEGRLIFAGSPAEVAADPGVRRAYLGSYAHGRGEA